METMDLTSLDVPPGRRFELNPFPTTGIVLRQVGDTVAVAAGANGQTGFGVWRLDTGRLLWWNDVTELVVFLTDTMLSCDYFPYPQRLVLLSWPELTELAAIDGPELAEQLVVSPSERTLVVWQNSGSGENGYQVFSLDGTLRRLGDHIGLTENPMWTAPAISPKERLVACAPGNGSFWMPPYEDWPEDWAGEEPEIPSTGGQILFGHLLIHDLDTDVVTRHELRYDLEPGWVPDDVWDARWNYGPIGLEFPAEDRIRLQQPDSTWVELDLPLPDSVLLPTPSRVLPPDEADG